MLVPLFRKRVALTILPWLAAVAAPLAANAKEPLIVLADGQPALDPVRYFTGRTRSWGLFETRSGAPRELLATETCGRVESGVLHFEQDLVFGEGKKMHRSWLIKRMDAHHYTATGTGIVGIAQGVSAGNGFHLAFTLDAIPGTPLAHVHMSQWMYLQDDGVTLINRDTLTKLGFTVAQITERFEKSR